MIQVIESRAKKKLLARNSRQELSIGCLSGGLCSGVKEAVLWLSGLQQIRLKLTPCFGWLIVKVKFPL